MRYWLQSGSWRTSRWMAAAFMVVEHSCIGFLSRWTVATRLSSTTILPASVRTSSRSVPIMSCVPVMKTRPSVVENRRDVVLDVDSWAKPKGTFDHTVRGAPRRTGVA